MPYIAPSIIYRSRNIRMLAKRKEGWKASGVGEENEDSNKATDHNIINSSRL